MNESDMLMEYQLALADLAAAQLRVFAVLALHAPDRRSGLPTMCKNCHQKWPCETRQAMDS